MAKPEMKHAHEWLLVGPVLVTFSIEGTIDDALWNSMLEDMKSERVRAVFAMAGGPASISSTQRKAAADVMQSRNLPAIVVTNSRITRGVLTALSWLGARIQTFSWDNLDIALLEVPDETSRAQIKVLAASFKERFAGSA